MHGKQKIIFCIFALYISVIQSGSLASLPRGVNIRSAGPLSAQENYLDIWFARCAVSELDSLNAVEKSRALKVLSDCEQKLLNYAQSAQQQPRNADILAKQGAEERDRLDKALADVLSPDKEALVSQRVQSIFCQLLMLHGIPAEAVVANCRSMDLNLTPGQESSIIRILSAQVETTADQKQEPRAIVDLDRDPSMRSAMQERKSVREVMDGEQRRKFDDRIVAEIVAIFSGGNAKPPTTAP